MHHLKYIAARKEQVEISAASSDKHDGRLRDRGTGRCRAIFRQVLPATRSGIIFGNELALLADLCFVVFAAGVLEVFSTLCLAQSPVPGCSDNYRTTRCAHPAFGGAYCHHPVGASIPAATLCCGSSVIAGAVALNTSYFLSGEHEVLPASGGVSSATIARFAVWYASATCIFLRTEVLMDTVFAFVLQCCTQLQAA